MDSTQEGPAHQFEQSFSEVSNTAGTEPPSFQSISEPISMFHNDHNPYSSFPFTRRLSCDDMFSDFNLQSLREPYHHDTCQFEGKNTSDQHAVNAKVFRCSRAPASCDDKPNQLGFHQNAGFEERTITNSNLSTRFATVNPAHQNHGESFNAVATANASFAATFSTPVVPATRSYEVITTSERGGNGSSVSTSL
jgi:hypothetical protein